MNQYYHNFHIRKKSEANTWVNRLKKAGYSASCCPVTDERGYAGHGAGSFGWHVEVRGVAETWDDFYAACLSFQPIPRWLKPAR